MRAQRYRARVATARPHVVLVGPPGAGKTTIGTLIARVLGVDFLDTDHEVERVAGMSIPDLFLARGEPEFRQLEHEVVSEVLKDHPGVIALGGGAVLHPGTQEALRGHEVVFLDVDVAQALPRVGLSGVRPLLMGDPVGKFNALMTERRPIYEGVATMHVVTTDRRPQEIAEEILLALSGRGDVIVDPAQVREAVAEHGPASRVHVSGTAGYDVVVGHGLEESVLELVGEAATRVLVVHPASLTAAAERLRATLTREGRTAVLHEIPDAEQAKTIDTVAACWALLGEQRFGREDAVVALGGGATTDVAGFVAATWLRGVRLVNVPTTLLGMVDAAVGGKTGINTAEGKNLVGAFYPPAGVVCDLDTLPTLPPEQLRSGLAEVVKAGFIADEQILRIVEANGGAGAQDPRSAALRELVERAVAVKARVVGEDLREAGLREILNYGHTLGHAIERTEDYRWRHGDAVAVGMVFAAELARAAGMLDADVVRRHRDILGMLHLPVSYRGDRWPELYDAMAHDKKVRGNALRFVVLEDVARPTILRAPDRELLEEAYARVSGR
ncbi:3-dehydroquinate synthase [Georgenia thermotolerans]|uniref:Multifunctional fusion protein n=2 Tax=Georgenia thermotolerans TaxID=527326 RepID=A0A7J5UP80_9MICO|nr:3-dehydroquinate synthase [Georgenia thermotolerans]